MRIANFKFNIGQELTLNKWYWSFEILKAHPAKYGRGMFKPFIAIIIAKHESAEKLTIDLEDEFYYPGSRQKILFNKYWECPIGLRIEIIK